MSTTVECSHIADTYVKYLLTFQTLLKELEEFAFKGIPDVRGCKSQDAQILQEMVSCSHTTNIQQCYNIFVAFYYPTPSVYVIYCHKMWPLHTFHIPL